MNVQIPQVVLDMQTHIVLTLQVLMNVDVILVIQSEVYPLKSVYINKYYFKVIIHNHRMF